MDDYKDFYWINVKNWWNNINIDNNLFNNEYFTPKTENDKNIFKIKFLYVLKQIFEIENLEYIDKIVCYNNCEIQRLPGGLVSNVMPLDLPKVDGSCERLPSNIQSRIHYINSENIYNNILKNKNLFKLFIQDDNKLKKIFEYIIQYKDYLKLIIQKILNIFKPLFEEDYFDKLINIDEDITRIISPIAGTFLYLYITNNDLEYVIETFLNLDYVYIEFFMISYLIIDNIMDNSKITSTEKKKFMVWFMNIVSNPEDTIFIGHEATEQNVWRYILFKKYYDKFIERYPPNKYPNIYEYVKIMINMLNTANKVQRDKNSSEEQILEYTFKKSYVVSYFIALLINIELNKTLDENKLLQMSKLVFLIQLYDDIADIEKDIIENNYTYFARNRELAHDFWRSLELAKDSSGAQENLSSEENNLFELKLKKTIYATYDFLNSFDKIENVNSNDNNIYNIIYYILENSLLYILYINSNKMNNDLLDNFFKHSLISIDCLKYFDKNSYDQFNGNFMIKIIDKNINNGELELEKFGENFDV